MLSAKNKIQELEFLTLTRLKKEPSSSTDEGCVTRAQRSLMKMKSRDSEYSLYVDTWLLLPT